ncbi:MAG TPA: hypothetical protein VL401_03855 [Alphaproteobacteria bacterium]|nr:hypothetical protein [Alphaproteobacteria bacterium]
MFNIADFASSIVVLTGPSGSGKDEERKKLLAECEAKGIKFFYRSSGDLFRAAAKSNKAISSEMAKGFVGTLETIMQPLVDVFEQHIVTILEGKNSILALDGVLRIGKKTREDGVVIPPQIEQVGEAFTRALRHVLENRPELREKLDSELVSQVLSHEDVPCLELQPSGITLDFASNIQHCQLVIPRGDAEALMRVRSSKALTKIKEELENNHRDKDVENLLKFLDKACWIQSGEIFDKPNIFAHFTDAEGAVADYYMKTLIKDFYGSQGFETPDKPSLKSAIEGYLLKAEITLPEGFEIPREDDDKRKTKDGRLNAYRDETIPMLVSLGLTHEEGSRLTEISNGPSRMDYETFKQNAQIAAEKIVEYTMPYSGNRERR